MRCSLLVVAATSAVLTSALPSIRLEAREGSIDQYLPPAVPVNTRANDQDLITKLFTAPQQEDRAKLLNQPGDYVFDFADLDPPEGSATDGGDGGVSVSAHAKSMPALIGLNSAMMVAFLGPCGMNTAHVHPRATELNIVVKGRLVTNFIVNNGLDHIANTMDTFQMSVFPQGAIHQEFNPDCEEAVFVASFNNQDPGVVSVAQGFFGLRPDVVEATLGGPVTFNGADVETFRDTIPKNIALGIEQIDPAIRLRRAIHTGDATLVSRILTSHPALLHNPDTSPPGLCNSNLHLAASLGRGTVVQVLLERGHEKPCPALNDRHQTALMLAAGAGHAEVVDILCRYDRECILRRDARGRDAIMEASMGGHDTVLQLLLTYAPCGATEAVRRTDGEGNTALHFASGNGNLLALRILLAAGADVESRNVWNWTPAAYSATVQAEVYLKGLVTEVSRQALRKELSNGQGHAVNVDPAKMAGGVRVVTADVEDDDRI
ncbi:spherulin-1B precursor [Emericellopsis atlantica]|uniref:Spherulin-1B n=1 Tax=Emericellopsis atlantica TaxID=2614577 RepID=A0A9P8CLE5_9HYPO|nr:spherulin-1B precursor [Emericellopsis atlantica]KAG9250992.1 spherulin-1B precursor [Emericellopsis atlantica]